MVKNVKTISDTRSSSCFVANFFRLTSVAEESSIASSKALCPVVSVVVIICWNEYSVRIEVFRCFSHTL